MGQRPGQSQTLAAIYADAILPLAGDDIAPQALLEQMREVADLLAAEPGLLAWLDNPAIDRKARGEVAFKALDGKVCDLLRDSVCVMAKRGRASLLGAVADEIERLLLDRSGVKTVIVTTATAMDDATRASVGAWITRRYGEKTRLAFRLDPDIIGGLVVRCGDDVTDLSLRKDYREITARLTRSADRFIQDAARSTGKTPDNGQDDQD